MWMLIEIKKYFLFSVLEYFIENLVFLGEFFFSVKVVFFKFVCVCNFLRFRVNVGFD